MAASSLCLAQRTVSGNVKNVNSDGSMPIVGASVVVEENTSMNATTDMHGEYLIDVGGMTRGHVQASALGFEPDRKTMYSIVNFELKAQKSFDFWEFVTKLGGIWTIVVGVGKIVGYVTGGAVIP